MYYRFDESWKNLQKVPREETVEAPKWLSHYECILHDEVFLPAWKLLKVCIITTNVTLNDHVIISLKRSSQCLEVQLEKL